MRPPGWTGRPRTNVVPEDAVVLGSISLLAAIGDPSQGFRGQLWHISIPGGETRRVTNDLLDYELYSLDLTRDRKTLVAIESRTASNLWVAIAGDASRARRITSGSLAVSSLSWMPDSGIVFRDWDGELISLRPDGGNRTVIVPGGQNNSSPAACGDGRYIVFSSFRDEKVNVWRIEEDGSNPTQLTNEAFAYAPSCSPDGKWVLYVLWESWESSAYPHFLLANNVVRSYPFTL